MAQSIGLGSTPQDILNFAFQTPAGSSVSELYPYLSPAVRAQVQADYENANRIYNWSLAQQNAWNAAQAAAPMGTNEFDLPHPAMSAATPTPAMRNYLPLNQALLRNRTAYLPGYESTFANATYDPQYGLLMGPGSGLGRYQKETGMSPEAMAVISALAFGALGYFDPMSTAQASSAASTAAQASSAASTVAPAAAEAGSTTAAGAATGPTAAGAATGGGLTLGQIARGLNSAASIASLVAATAGSRQSANQTQAIQSAGQAQTSAAEEAIRQQSAALATQIETAQRAQEMQREAQLAQLQAQQAIYAEQLRQTQSMAAYQQQQYAQQLARQQEQAELDVQRLRRENQRNPDFASSLAATRRSGAGTQGGSMLTGASGVDPATLLLGRAAPLGA